MHGHIGLQFNDQASLLGANAEIKPTCPAAVGYCRLNHTHKIIYSTAIYNQADQTAKFAGLSAPLLHVIDESELAFSKRGFNMGQFCF